MGRQAKLRQQRQQQPATPPATKAQDFVKDLEQRGYSRREIARSPDLPDDRARPQV